MSKKIKTKNHCYVYTVATGGCGIITTAKLAEDLGTTTEEVRQSIKELQGAGLINIINKMEVKVK